LNLYKDVPDDFFNQPNMRMTNQMLTSILYSVVSFLCAAGLFAENIHLKLGPDLVARSGHKQLAAAPAESGVGFVVNVPKEVWPSEQGTIMMRMKVSRRIGHAATKEFITQGSIIQSPDIRLGLNEGTACPSFSVQSPTMKGGRAILFSYLLPHRWYHLALSWKSTGESTLYINGWAQQRIQLKPWKPEKSEVQLRLGGTLGKGEHAARLDVKKPEIYARSMSETQVRRTLVVNELCEVASGVRQSYERPIDLSGYKLKEIFSPDFHKSLSFVAEDDLFEGDKRVRQPAAGQWVLEGKARVVTDRGKLTIDNLESGGNHVVLWAPRVFPENFLLEFDITIEKEDEGLAIVFFAGRPRDDPKGSIFQPGLARRMGTFKNYIRGDINSYHVSYLAASGGAGMGGPRRTANVRKNSGFWMVACGEDQIQGKGLGRGPHKVKFLKVGNKIRVEANGRLSVSFDDDGKTYGPVLTDGYIGLRQMNHLLSAGYSNLKVYSVELK
jgi:hypothetical protein